MARYEHTGAAASTTLTAPLNSSDASFNIASGAGWPTGATGPFWCVIDQGLSTEEKILVTTRSANTLSGVTRGADNTTPVAHPGTTPSIKHIFSATEADQANAHVNATTAIHGSTGALVDIGSVQSVSGAKTFASPTLTGTVAVPGRLFENRVTTGASYTVTATDRWIDVITPSATITFDTGSRSQAHAVTVANLTDTNCTLTASGLTFQNSASTSTIVLNPRETITLLCDNVDWYVKGTTSKSSNEAWTAYTPTFTNITSGAGAFAYQLVGKTLRLRGYFSAGTVTANGVCRFSLPASLSVIAASVYQPVKATKASSVMISASASGTDVFFGKDTSYANWTAGDSLLSAAFSAEIEVT